MIEFPSENNHQDPIPNIQLEEKIVSDTDDGALFNPEEISDVTEEQPERRLPWFLDIWLYPLNLAGFLHLIFFWLLVFLICPFVMGYWGFGTEYIPIFFTVPIAFVLYSFTECIRYSASGCFRFPGLSAGTEKFDKWDCISQLLGVLGSFAICFLPASVYFIFTQRSDLIFWLLIVCGSFLSPIVLLAVVLHDSYSAINPKLIIASILRTFFPYCAMSLLLFSGIFLYIKIDPRIFSFSLLPTVPLILKLLMLYLMFTAAGVLGRFYFKYQKKLDWEV